MGNTRSVPSPAPVDESAVHPCHGRKTVHWFLRTGGISPRPAFEKSKVDLRRMIEILLGMDSRTCVKRIVLTPPTPALKDTTETASKVGVFPSLDRTAVSVGAKRERAVARVSDSQSVEVRDRRGQTYFAAGVGGVPQRQKELLCLKERWMCSSLDLALGIIDFEHLNVVGWEAFAERIRIARRERGWATNLARVAH